MPESVGSKIDRLITTNHKLWDLVEWHMQLKGPQDLKDPNLVWSKLEQMKELNTKRNALVKEIDQWLDSSGKDR